MCGMFAFWTCKCLLRLGQCSNAMCGLKVRAISTVHTFGVFLFSDFPQENTTTTLLSYFFGGAGLDSTPSVPPCRSCVSNVRSLSSARTPGVPFRWLGCHLSGDQEVWTWNPQSAYGIKFQAEEVNIKVPQRKGANFYRFLFGWEGAPKIDKPEKSWHQLLLTSPIWRT